MTTTSKIVVRIVFVLCMVLVLLTDYSGLIHKLIRGNRTEESSGRPRPTNPGYGDRQTDIDIDADIEDETIKQHIDRIQRRSCWSVHYVNMVEFPYTSWSIPVGCSHQ
ncbi:hypothetical protein HHI36_023344 [Cryptolaemus montrouzieri]|uniref:Uncharacterized protein n=1 Tax=Cryptolaemus montrouzieri TaxID=559131 RepID=A0ABD2PGU6_9CUCU